MKKIILFIITSLISIQLLAATGVTGIVVFGDSLSDNGNLYALKKGTVLTAPYYKGRCTNGPVWVEVLTKKLHLPPTALQDYAIAGAQSNSKKPAGVKTQIKRYIDQNPQLNPNKLYVIWVGGNNYLFHPYARKWRVKSTINDINKSITELAQHGAKYFLIPNLPDLGETPIAANLQKKHPHLNWQTNLTKLSDEHNTRLAESLPPLAKKLNVTLILMDDNSLIKTAIKQPEKFGLKNVTEPCYQAPKLFMGGGLVCKNPSEYLYWDVVHPTEVGHIALADLAVKTLAVNNLCTRQFFSSRSKKA